MTDNNEDIDDFDIYADLDDNIDLNFNDSDNCFDNYKSFPETDLPSILAKTSDENNEINTEFQTKSSDNTDFEAENYEMSVQSERQSDQRQEPEPSNDLILSEITILEKSLNKTEDINKSLIKQNIELKQQMKEKERQLTVLKTNISSLYKTAKAEIERKKQEIHGLRDELDSMIFRRLPRNGIKVDNNETSVEQIHRQTEDKSVCHKSSQTSDRDVRQNSNSNKRSPDSSVRSPKERPTTDRRSRKSRTKSPQRTQQRSRSRSSRRNRSSPSKSSQRPHKSRSKSPQKCRKSRSKSPQRTRRRSRSRSSQRNKTERKRTPDRDRHRTNSDRKSKTSSNTKTEDKKRKSDKSDAKPQTDPKRQISDKQ